MTGQKYNACGHANSTHWVPLLKERNTSGCLVEIGVENAQDFHAFKIYVDDEEITTQRFRVPVGHEGSNGSISLDIQFCESLEIKIRDMIAPNLRSRYFVNYFIGSRTNM